MGKDYGNCFEELLSVTWRLRVSLICCEELINGNLGDYYVDDDRWSETATAAETCHRMTSRADSSEKAFATIFSTL